MDREAAEEAMREADRRKDEFLATLAHELRNPLAPIRHAVKLLESAKTAPQQQQWAREVIARQMQRMALMLDDLLEVSRITRGRLDVKPEIVRLDTLVNTAVETARPLIDSKQQNLTITLPADPPLLRADPLRISQSISNLLTNAAKYTDINGHIALSAELQGDAIKIRVKDDGIGLAREAMPNLFQMFSQVDPALDRAQGGLGIGLALVKGLIELHAGTVEVASEGIGHGSEFTITLPGTLLVTETWSNVAVLSVDPSCDVTNKPISASPSRSTVAEPTSVHSVPSVDTKPVNVSPVRVSFTQDVPGAMSGPAMLWSKPY